MRDKHIGIVGSEAAKFTDHTEVQARDLIRELLAEYGSVLVSGGCHLGGIDIWAEEIADEMGREKIIHLPAVHNWRDGYKPRNLLIVKDSDEVHCITVASYPPGYYGMRFTQCYHCFYVDTHVKSGGCWTMMRARIKGKLGVLHVIKGDHDA